MTCKILNCGLKHRARGLCKKHYERVRLWGRLELQTFEMRFWAKVKKTESCWMWIGAQTKLGYGTVRHLGKQRRPHRISYEMHYGAIPLGLCVCHKCDVPLCVRPGHLWLGTIDENNKDKAKKNRAYRPKGELCPAHKLTAKQVIQIRKEAEAPGFIQRVCAKKYKISPTQMFRIINRTRWAHL